MSRARREGLLDAQSYSTQELQDELTRIRNKRKFSALVWDTLFRFVVAAALAVLLATMVFPVLIIQGNSMAPTLQNGDIMLCYKGQRYQSGDSIAFYYNNMVLVKRVIAGEGQWVNMDEDGNVFVNDVRLYEDYITDKTLGDCDITFPLQVPSGSYFVLGDHRSTSFDSRMAELGCVHTDYIVGGTLCRLWSADDSEEG